MAETLSVWRSSSVGTIEGDLATLWRETAFTGPVSRALMANLVVIEHCGHPAGEASGGEASPGEARYDSVAGAVGQQHPVRALLLRYTPGIVTASAPHAARVGLLTFGSSGARYGIELIAIQTACADASIPSIVRRLTRGDVPTSVWWRGDASRTPPGLATTLGRQFLYDSARWHDPRAGLQMVADISARPLSTDIADLNWRRLAPVRQAIVHGLGSEPKAGDLLAAGVVIRYGTGQAASAWLIAGWFHASLQWPPADRPRIEPAESPVALSVTMGGAGWSVHASLEERQVRVTGSTQPPFTLWLPRESEADEVAAEMRRLGRDAHLNAAVQSAAILAQ